MKKQGATSLLRGGSEMPEGELSHGGCFKATHKSLRPGLDRLL